MTVHVFMVDHKAKSTNVGWPNKTLSSANYVIVMVHIFALMKWFSILIKLTETLCCSQFTPKMVERPLFAIFSWQNI